MDVSHPRAGERGRAAAPRPLPPMQRERIQLLHGSLIYRDTRLDGLRRRGGRRGDRAPRPAAAGGVRARAVRVRAAEDRSCSRRRTSSTTCGSRASRPASSATATTASSGRGPSSSTGPTDVAPRFGYAVRFLPDRPERPRCRLADADGGLHAAGRRHEAHDPRAVARRRSSARPARASRRSRAGTSSRPRCSRPTSAAGSCRDDENDQAATTDAFEVLHFIAAQAARGGAR